MVIEALDLDNIVLTLDSDKGEEKTEFIVSPLTQFEYMKYASIYQSCLGEVENDSKPEDIVGIFASEKGIKLQEMMNSFFNKHIEEVRNFKIKGVVHGIMKKNELNIDMFPPMYLFELISKTVAKMSVGEEEEKN